MVLLQIQISSLVRLKHIYTILFFSGKNQMQIENKAIDFASLDGLFVLFTVTSRLFCFRADLPAHSMEQSCIIFVVVLPKKSITVSGQSEF